MARTRFRPECPENLVLANGVWRVQSVREWKRRISTQWYAAGQRRAAQQKPVHGFWLWGALDPHRSVSFAYGELGTPDDLGIDLRRALEKVKGRFLAVRIKLQDSTGRDKRVYIKQWQINLDRRVLSKRLPGDEAVG